MGKLAIKMKNKKEQVALYQWTLVTMQKHVYAECVLRQKAREFVLQLIRLNCRLRYGTHGWIQCA